MIPDEPKLTITTYFALLVYMLISVFIWFPVGLLCASVNLKLTVLIFGAYFVKEVCRIYLGIKV